MVGVMPSMVILRNPRLEFRNEDHTFERFEAIEGLESTFEPEGGRPGVVVIALRGLPDADRKRLIACILPKKIIVEAPIAVPRSLEISHLEAAIKPTGEAKSLRGEFTKDEFKISPGSDLLRGSPTYEVKLEAWIVSPVKMEKDLDFDLRP
jgi:hypothetical protein